MTLTLNHRIGIELEYSKRTEMKKKKTFSNGEKHTHKRIWIHTSLLAVQIRECNENFCNESQPKALEERSREKVMEASLSNWNLMGKYTNRAFSIAN